MKQGYNARLDDSLGMKHGKKSQSLKARRDESEGMSKKVLSLPMSPYLNEADQDAIVDSLSKALINWPSV